MSCCDYRLILGSALDRGLQSVPQGLLAVVMLSAGCDANQTTQAKKPQDPSLVLSTAQADSRVENGWAYDKVILNVGDCKEVVVPADAEVEQGGREGRVEIYLEKRLALKGHPVNPVSIREERKKTGCARKTKDNKLTIGTYGEGGGIEGGLSLKLLIRVPVGLKVEKQKGLSGPVAVFGPPPPPRIPITPGEDGWEAIPDEPDNARTVKSPDTK